MKHQSFERARPLGVCSKEAKGKGSKAIHCFFGQKEAALSNGSQLYELVSLLSFT
jgi:hypothetical protein